ncbi:LPD38 domain-containing protein [uncultured Prevotella sp.]|uniref:LPD38 domain-containing protein n=1 Tax=uncultured Prevotella sp. TaxID=159272 RepID=UPI0025D613C9|nr:LPD38 domain-containing protein [uncultured Prevotella sp.]
MAIDRSKLQRMYKLMADNGYSQDYNTFEKKFTGNSNYANRKAVYDLFTKNGADLGGSYEEFMRKLQKPRATKPQQQPKTALGRAQQSVAKEKWGGGVVTHGNTTAYESASAPMENDSELVRGLKNANAVQRLQAPVSYTKPGAVKQMVGRVHGEQQMLDRRIEKAGREAGKDVQGEIRRRNAPAFDLGNENVNNNLVKTRGQLEDELEESSRQLVDKQLGGYINNSIQKMFKDATVKGAAAEDALSKASPFAYMVAGKAYNEALDPDKLMNQLSKNAEKDMAGLFSDPKMQKEIVEKAASFGIDPEDYVKNYIAPGLQAKISEEFEKSELSRNMPKSTAEYIIRGVNDSMIGTILSMGMMSKKQRQYAQQGMAMTDNGENPYVKPGMGARVARGTLSFAADAPVFGALGKAGAAVAGKVMGNGVAQAARIANTSLGGRIGRMAAAGIVSQGVTGVLYGSTNAAVQNYSTGDDTSIGNTVKLMIMGGLSEGASWATMGGIGGAVGAGIYNVSGVKRIPAKVFQIAMEGWGMHMGGNVAKMIEGHDTDWLSVEGNLEACANVVALKLTHARLPKRYTKDGKKESYLDMVARNIKNLMTSDGQRAAFGGYTFTNEEKEQLFGSDKAPKREETLYGYDVHDNPLTKKESLTSWAMRAKKTAAKGKGEESYKDTDAEFVKTAYDEIMADNTIPWDTKAKFSALVMGTVPSARPMMDHIAIERDERGAYVGEYSLYGELLSKNRYKTADEYVSIKYNLVAKKENQRLSNAYGAAQIKDEKAAQETLETVAETFGFTAEQMKAAIDKDPLKRSEEEQNACVALRKAYEGEQFPEGTLHPDQSQTEGKDVVEENNLGTENPNNEAVAEVLNNMNNAEKAFNAALESNDVLKQEYERLTKEGLSEPQIYMELINSGLTQEQLAPFADYINAKAKAVGMYRGTEQKIAETVQKHVEQWSYKSELNGEKQDGGQMLFVKDNNGRLLIVGAGDVAFDSEGRARESVGDMLSVLDPNTKETDFVSKKDVQLDHVEKTDDYAKNYQTMLEEKNSVVYAESEKGKEKSEKSEGGSEELRVKSEESNGDGGDKPGEQPEVQRKVAEGKAEDYEVAKALKEKIGGSLSEEDAANLVGEMESRAKEAHDMPLTPENWEAEFGEDGKVQTPLGEVKMGENQLVKLFERGRSKEFGMIKPTLSDPDVVIEVPSESKDGKAERDTSLLFIKTFKKPNGEKVYYFKSVTIKKDGIEISISSHYDRKKRVEEALENGKLLYLKQGDAQTEQSQLPVSGTTFREIIAGLNDKDSNNSANGNGNNETLTFADGSHVPMMKDTKGRETADYSQMTPEQGAEWMSSQFGENAEAAVDGQIKRAEKMLNEAEKIKVDYTGDLNDAKEAEAQKTKAVDAAKAELELYTNIKKVMTANKVKAGMEKVGAVGEEGSVSEAGNLGAVREKFESGKRIVGNKRTRTLADGSKLRGHYEIVEADSLTPSHNANDGYKKSEGFPVNEEGRTINDRDYENDKQAQLVTDMIAMKYDGQAVDQVPVVTADGIVVDGNGRTMAGQKAAKNGTDSAYLEALKENAENYGFTAEQIEQSGIKHPRLVLVSDEPMKYDTATFAKFNKNEKKTQGNTQQAVANSKKLSADEIGTIISEIEGSGSLDAFFNNPTAINSLLKRLIDKGVIGLNEVAGLREGEDKLSAAGKDFVKNLLLGSVFSENTIRMMGADAMLKTKALNGIRAVTDNMKLGDYALMNEIDHAMQLMYEAHQDGSGVDAYLRTPAMFGENAADRYDPISQAIALALEGKVEDFRELMMAYNRNAAHYADASQAEMFGEKPTKEEFVKEFLKFRNWKNYETRHSSKEGNGDAGSTERTEPQARGGSDPRGSEERRVKSEESEGDKLVGDGKEPKTNPLEGMRKAAELFKNEQIEKARAELAEAKKSGDASEVKRLTDKLKGLMDSKLRGNGIGLVERRRIIGREIGKILGEEAGKAEAEKIDKPWEQMDLEEREAVSSKNPLTETEINELTSEENRELIPAALAYLRGDKGNIINAISYFKIWNDVRSRHENVPDNSGAKDGTQLDAPDTGGSQELGLGRGREGGRPDGPVDRTDSERTTPGERESGTSGENDTTVSAGKPSVDKGEGNTPGMDAVSAGSSDTRGGGGAGNEGNVPKRGGQGGGNRPLDPNAGRKPAAKQGTHFPDSTSERLKQERAEYEQKKKDFWERWKKAGQGYMKIALTPFKALNLSPEQIEMLPELFKMHLNGAVLKIKEGIYKFNEWKASMRAEEGEELKMIGLSDDDIDRFIEDYWNTPYQMDGETHTIGEWAGIHGNEELRNKLSEPLNDKYQMQVDAEPIKVKIGDKKNIEETLPYLLPQQQEDVLKAETQFFGKEHTDREHAYGKGYMFTNGTGTGKTFTGLGIAKRLVKHGKGRILIVTPSQKKVSDWIKDGRNLNMEIRDLDDWAKERGTTATTESGDGVVITTFANFGMNKKLLETKWDAVIYDESHRIMENKNGAETARSMQHYMVTNRSEQHCFLRLQETNKDYQKVKDLGERFDAERDKEVKRIQDEYKASHPSATARGVAYATSKMLPKERNGFTPGDYASFPKLGKIHAEFVKALSHYTNEVKPKLEAQAKNEWKDTKTIFLSATPFNTRENLNYVEGYIFKYPKVENSGRMSGRTQFYLDHFGAGYKFRYNRLEQSTSNPEAVAKQEIAFSDYLQHTLGTMSGRIIDSPYDYSRDFPTVSPDHAERFNQAVQEALTSNSVLAEAYRKTIGDYNYGSALFETMKVANIIERIKAHLDAGRKVVIFHRRVDTKEPIKPPFASMLEKANRLITIMNEGNDKKNEAIQAVRDFRKKYADLLKWEQTLDYSMPREQIAKVFGKDNVLFFSGKESTKVKDKAVDTFNDDNSGKNIIVIQEASGKEGISLHDKTGKHQRVCITLALPQSPITALQIEGRTYRIGNKSNAIFEYPILGLNSEMMLFGQKFNNQVSTTENLALGSQARSLRDSFANGILEHSGVVPIDQQGVGGKEFDAPKDQSTDGFDNAVLDYYSNQKLNSRNREGVDYFPTPEPLGYKMMEWANMGEGDTVMEPSAGHGAIARYAPKGNQMVAIEPSQSLFAKLQLKAGGLGRKFVNTIFENYDISNKHDVVVMNPPFGTAGATAIAHLGKAFKHLEEGGRVVAIIPRGSTDKKFEKWINGEKTAVMRAEVELPDIVFKQAGTKVVCRVVVVDKISNEAMRAKAGRVEKVSLGGHYDKIEDFFEDLRDIEMPDRIIDTNTIMQKKSKQTAKDLKELKDVTVNLNEHGINVHVRGDRNDYSIMFDLGEYNAEQRKSILSGTYERFEEYERYTRDETSQAVIAELKKLTCKLAGMTEEEMQRYLKKQNEGKGVMYRVEHAAEVYNKTNTHYRMELGNTFSDNKEHFDAVRDRAVEEKGIVMPNLNKEKVKVVEVEKHGFGSKERETINNAKAWAISNLVTTGNQDLPTMRDGTSYTISKKAIEKYLSESAVKKSENLDTHLSVLTKLTDVIHESIEAEIHADYNVKDETGKRKAELGYGNNILVHRLYGAVEMDGKIYRVKTTMQEFRGGEENKPHSYEVTKIELLDSPGKRENPDRPPSDASNNSIDTAKLLQGVEKSYDSGKKLLDESKNLTDGETFFRKEGNGVVTPEKTSNAVSERIIKTVEKVAKRTGGKVKMVNSVEEIENPKVRKDIEKGKQVTGWYDEKTGEVHLYMPNIHDTYTAEKTVWHETVGHKGMRGLLGDKFNDYMRGLWMDLDNPINAELRAYVKEKMNMNHLGFYDAIEEFIAKSAEDGKGEPGFWNYIKNKVTDALHEIGYRVSPNVKDVKYMLWLAKNVQKYGDSPLWKMRAEAVRWKIEHEKTEYTKIDGGELYDNDGKNHDFESMSREEWLEATDGEIHYRTAPNAATALDRYHHALDRHSYMATEAFMDNMLSLKKLMEAIDPSIKKIEDVNSSMNPYLMQNITEGMMSDKSKLFEIRYMDPLSKAMSSVLGSFDGKKVEDRIRNFNLYMIRKHGLERNRVLFVRDWIREERKVKSEESDSIDALETAWKGEKYDLRKKLDSGQIDLKEYYRQMDEWIVQNLDKDFKAEEHDYSGMHGLQGIDDMKSPYDDAGAIDDVMSQEASMEGMKQGSVADFWKKVKAATDYSVNSDYESGLISKNTHDGVLGMFDWYVPLRKFDEATAEDVYGYVTEMGDPSNYIGTTLMNAKGRKSLSNVEILAQIGLMGNRAIRNGGQNMIKQAFARFVRNSGEQNLVKETKVWVEKIGTDRNGNDIWEEAYPKIPEGAEADEVAEIVDDFEADMKAKQANGEAKTLSSGTDIGFKFQRAKDKNQHFVDVKIAGRTHRFVVLGNPRAAQALNGMLENGKASQKWLQTVTRWMAMASTSWSPEFVMRNIVRDMEFASSHVAAKEGGRYLAKWSRYYIELNPLNVFYNEGAGRLKSMKMKDFKNGVGYGLYARYREGTLGNSKMERYFKEFMENGGETGFVQLFSMHDMEKSYKSIVEKESAKGAKKVMVNAVEVLKKLGENVENLNEVAENMARFATYCTSRDLGRSAARSAYDAKEVSTNFNRHGSGDAIKSFKNGEMGDWQKARRNTYGFVAGYLRNYSMFFNAGIQSTNLLFKNIKRAPVGTTVAMTSAPFALALIMAAVNNAIIQNEDDKDRGNVKDPYGELPDYIRRNNLCIYVGNNKFVTVPLAIELRAFYSLGDLAAGQTFAKNVKSQRNMAMDAVGCMSQLFPVMDFLNNPNYENSLENGVVMTTEGIAFTAIVPFIEWWLNNDWKGAPIRRTGDKTELNPAWQNAYNKVPARLVDLNKWVNAKTNNIAPGNPEMKGNEVLDWATDPSMLNHFFGSWSGGMGTFTQRTAGLVAKATTGKTDEIEVGDVPFLRSLFYTPREHSSMARTKAKWYNYKEEMEPTIANYDKLKSKNVPTMKRIENAAALEKFEGSPEQRKVNIIKNAEKRMRHWNTMRKKWADDKKQVDFANKNIEMIMQEAVEDLDRIE